MSLDFVPDARDGLTSIERTLLRLASPSGASYEKTRAVLEAAKRLVQGHDRQLLYDALVRLSSPHLARHRPFEGQGNFGSIDGDPPASSKYNEIRRAALGQALMGDAPAGDGSAELARRARALLATPAFEPTQSAFPGVLANGAWEGVSAIPPHNLGELAAAVAVRLRNPSCGLDAVMAVLPGPDFPTGGLIVDQDEVRAVYATGSGKITVRGVAHIEPALLPGEQQIVVTELPFLVVKGGADGLFVEFAQLAGDRYPGKLRDLNDESSRRGLRMAFWLRADVDAAAALEVLYSETSLETELPALMVALDHTGKPRQWTLLELLDAVIDHQRSIVVAEGVEGDEATNVAIEARLTAFAREFGDARRTKIGPTPMVETAA